MILVPVKDLATAKQPLSGMLPQSSLTELAQAMLHDVLASLLESRGDEVVLVTSDPFAMELAWSHGFGIVRDDSNQSETEAIAMATRVCGGRGIQSTLVIPADIPLIAVAELEA